MTANLKTQIDLEKIRMDALKKVAELNDIDDRTRSLKLLDFMTNAIKEEMKGKEDANREQSIQE